MGFEAVYLQEKQWIASTGAEIPEQPALRRDQSWFFASADGEPAGVIRLVYDPCLDLPAGYGLTLEPGFDLEGLRDGIESRLLTPAR